MKKNGKNFIYNLIYQVFILIMPLITSPYISRVFGPSGVGTYSYYFTIATYFTYFELLGVNNYGVREIAKCKCDDERNKVFSGIYLTQLMVSLLVLFIYFLSCFIFGGENFWLMICFIPYVISGGLDINWYFFGTEQFKITTIKNIIIKSAVICLIFLVIKFDTDLLKYVLIISFGYLFSQIIMWMYLLKKVSFYKPYLKDITYHLKRLLILFIPVLAISLYRLMDKVMLGLISNMEQVGYYESAEKIVGVPGAVTTALGISMLPRMTNLSDKNDDILLKKNIYNSIYFIEFLCFPMIFGLIAVSDIFIPLYYGTKFIESSMVLKILSISLIFSSVASVVRTQYLVPKEKDNIYIISVILGAIVNLIINSFLIKYFGANGAALGTIFAEATVAIYQIFMLRKELPLVKTIIKGWIFFVIGFIMFIAIYFLNIYIARYDYIITLIIDIVVGIIIYLLFSSYFILIFIKRVNEYGRKT